ncbi:MAG TPA: hypothetical protein VNC50_05455 [Planctomycetia bacterium]|jgi:hypothetical protein|nr:hypothetical protein [Planctomycetia bacterium]
MEPFRELLEASLQSKKGLVFYFRGQQVAGVVVKAPENGVVELRNQAYGRILIRLDNVDAVAIA